MFEGTHELAESKLVLLYIFDKIGYPISNTSLTEIVLENGLLNYFQLQQYIGELVSAGFIFASKQDKKQLYSIDTKGKNALGYFENRISSVKKDTIDSYFSKRSTVISKDIQISSDYNLQAQSDYDVICRITENNNVKIEIRVNTDSEEKAKRICSKWNSDASKMYIKFMDILTG